MRYIYTYVISDGESNAGSEQKFRTDGAGTVTLPAKCRINGDGIIEKANETNIKIGGTVKNPKVILVDLGDVHSINDPRTSSQNGHSDYISQNRRAVRTDNQQTFMNTIFQPALLLFNTALIIFTLIHR